MLRLSILAAALLASGCSAAISPDAALSTSAISGGTAVNIYWPCLLNIPMPDLMKSRPSVMIDGKEVGQIGPCEYRRFEVSAGQHAIRFVEQMFPDIAGAFGLEGPKYTVQSGRPIFIRLYRYKYIEEHEVSAEEGLRGIAQIASNQ